MASRPTGYALALLSSLSYSAWLIASDEALAGGNALGSLVFAMLVALATSVALSARSLRSIGARTFGASVVGGFAFAAGNLLLYLLIPEAGLGLASAFSSLNLLFFSLMLMGRSRPGNLPEYLGGSVLATVGLGAMYAAGGVRRADPLSIAMGIATGVLYALGTYVLYRTSSSGGVPASAVGIFAGEVVFLLFPFSLRPVLAPSIPAALAGVSLSVALLLEASGLRILSAFGGGRETIVNVLTNLELLPIALYYVATRQGPYTVYAASISVVIAGLILISEGVSRGFSGGKSHEARTHRVEVNRSPGEASRRGPMASI